MKFFGERSRLAELEPIGVIDIGSNSVRLVVYEGAMRATTPLFNEKILCGLGRSVATTGSLGDEARTRALAALVRFRAIMRVLGVKTALAVATAAVRDADDGQLFIKEAEATLGTKVEILSGTKEATLAAFGIQMGFPNADGFAGDLGGGSLELIDLSADAVRSSSSLPLGGLRLMDETGGSLTKAKKIIDEQLRAQPWLKDGKGRPFYVVGGTWRALARLHMHETDYPLQVMQGYEMDVEVAKTFVRTVHQDSLVERDWSVVSKARREILPYGALVLERVLDRVQPSHVIFSVFGIREGLLFSLLPKFERQKDPLIAFCEDYARMRSRSFEHAQELYPWTDRLFETAAIDETPEERRLRRAACLLSDISWRAHPDYRGEQSLDLVSQAGLGGVNHEGRMFLALSIYFRHAGQGAAEDEHLSEQLKLQVSKRLLRRARIIGASIRVGHMLSAGAAGVVDQTPLYFDRGGLVLELPPMHQQLAGERVDKRLGTLARLFDCPSRVEFVAT